VLEVLADGIERLADRNEGRRRLELAKKEEVGASVVLTLLSVLTDSVVESCTVAASVNVTSDVGVVTSSVVGDD